MARRYAPRRRTRVTRALHGTSGTPPAVRRVHQRRDAIFYGASGVFWIALDIAIAITFLVGSDTSLTLWLVLLCLLWFGVSSLAFARTSVVIRADEPFVVRNMYRRHEVRWSEVSGSREARCLARCRGSTW